MMERLVPYGIMNYAELMLKQTYFIDKTEYIGKIESIANPVFLRPRRFGKSLFCSMLRYYYDLNEAGSFNDLFGTTWIGKNPTGKQNSYLILSLDLSTIECTGGVSGIERNLRRICNATLIELQKRYPEWMGSCPDIHPDDSVSTNLSIILHYLVSIRGPQLYVIIDEYDNFANHLITTHQDYLYQKLTADDSFLKSFFKVLKSGRQSGAIANTFITGILPITIDDLTSAYNIADFITLHPQLEGMLGFTEPDIRQLIDDVYQDYGFDQKTKPAVLEVMKNQYDGYHFAHTGSGNPLYNSTLVMYFLREFCRFKTIPDNLIDMNLRTDLSWVERITGAHPENTEKIVSQLTSEELIHYDQGALVTQFNITDFFKPQFYPISFFYLGLLTKYDDFNLCLPNLSMKKIFVEYFNDIYRIDASTRYSGIMEKFIRNPDISTLFSGYWQEYISQLPEAVFIKVNENFYRTTFYELCSRFLSKWFTFTIEHSYPSGRSDLEFIGKYNEKFSGRRWIVEFKYYSNTEFHKFRCKPDEFQLQKGDIQQVSGYAMDLKNEYPEADLSLHIIYCFGNTGYKVYDVSPILLERGEL